MSFNNIPWELKACHNWVCWRYEQREGDPKPTKVPYNPAGYRASTNKPESWASFEQCRQAQGYSGIGFVFSNSPYAGIDLDPTEDANILAWHQVVAADMDSYAERSPSGKGLHIIVRGSVPDGKKDKELACEVYSDRRFFTMTGDVYLNRPIAERNEALNKLWSQLSGERIEVSNIPSQPETRSDEDILRTAFRAANGDKFKALWEGDTSGHSNDQSSADLALMNMLAFYTKNQDQLIRLFRRSALGQREKAGRSDYMAWTVRRALDGSLSTDEDLSPVAAFQAAFKQPVLAVEIDEPEETLEDEALNGFELTPDADIPWPPGLVGEIAESFYRMSLFPRRRVCIASALSVMSLLCGRDWFCGTMGLNLYTILLGKTGLGKSDGINCTVRLAQQLDRACTNVNFESQLSNKIRKEFVSKQGMHKDLAEHKSVLWIIDEVQIRIAAMMRAHSSSPEYGIKSFITANYTESGPFGSLSQLSYSKKENSLGAVSRPNVNWLGLGVPETFWQSVSYEQLQDGFLNRLLLLECPEHEDSTRNRVPDTEVPTDVIGRLAQVVFAALNRRDSIEVRLSDQVRDLDFKWSEVYRLNGSDKAKFAQARVAMNTLKVASLLAIGANPHAPVVIEQEYHWAHRLVMEGAKRMIAKFDRGETGSGDGKCVADLKAILREYFNPSGKWQKQVSARSRGQVISYAHLRKYSVGRKAFNEHTRGANTALDMTIKVLIAEGVLRATAVGSRGGQQYELLVKWKNI